MTPGPIPPPRQPELGVTLIEMLIVLVIIGVAGSAAVLGLGQVGRDRQAEAEATRLAAHLTLAVDESLVSRQTLILAWTPGGYAVQRQGPTGWQPAATPRLARPHALPASVVLRRLDNSTDVVTVAQDGLGPAVDLEVSGAGRPWIVAFDGFSALARPGSAP